MYKSKLQQVCQQNLWPLPKYSCLRDGPDHCPAFKASALVNGQSFESVSAFNSSKAAQNDAAMRAFFQLESDSTPPQSDTELAEDEPVKPEEKNEVADPSLEVLVTNEVECPYNLQLQTYAQKNHLSLPSYSVTSIGPLHACHFVACVTVGEHEFKTVTFSKTAKEAENAAAKIALTCLSPDGLEQIFPGHVKSLLQELAQKEGLSLPKYKTSHLGPVHMQLLYSTVEVGGVIFQGKAAKSKKLSEVCAAEVAYRSLEQRKLDRTSLLKPLTSPEAKSLDTKDLEKAIHELSVNINKSALQASDSAKVIKEQVIKYECEPNPAKKSHTGLLKPLTSPEAKGLDAKDLEKAIHELSVNVKKSALEALDSAKIIKEQLIKYESEPNHVKKSHTNEQAIVRTMEKDEESESKDSLKTPVEFLQGKSQELSVADPDGSKHTTCQSYLLNNRVRVYTTIPDVEFPKGITLIPIADNKWVPVSLEFPAI